jgi:LPXTG-motif cell wall-anchored protein
MFKKIATIAALLLVATIGVAQAQDYPPATNSLVASDNTVDRGQVVAFTARTFRPGTVVTFTFFSDPVRLGTATAGSNGVATLSAAIPANAAAGTHRVEATGTGSNGSPLTVSASLVVSGARDPLPKTGSDSTWPLATAGVLAVAVGGLLLLVVRRRHGAALGS